jgi:hypothetical protein
MRRKDVIISLLIGVIIAASLILTALLWARANAISTRINCSSAIYNHQQLEALAQIAHRLGIPQDFRVEKVPAACVG